MPPENAVILDNFIPRAGYVELRKGCRCTNQGGGGTDNHNPP
jgi:hypothetical protein